MIFRFHNFLFYSLTKPFLGGILGKIILLASMNHPKKERSFVMIKPDGVQRGLAERTDERTN
jgi:hypothetical protein